MNQDYTVTRAKHLKTLRTFLNRWRGGTARLWEFQAAHCHLTIRIERSGEHGNLHVICLGPEFIRGPVQWDDCVPEVHLAGVYGVKGSKGVEPLLCQGF
jgi:hypothetical protein